MPDEHHELYASLTVEDLPNVEPILVAFDNPLASSIISGEETLECVLKEIRILSHENGLIPQEKICILEKIGQYLEMDNESYSPLRIVCYDAEGNRVMHNDRSYAKMSDKAAPYVTDRKLPDDTMIKLLEMEALIHSRI